jgi:FkbM family methyltransferase
MDIYDFIKNTIPTLQNFTIVECGGHRGSDTKKLAELFANSQIHTIEANPILYNIYLLPLKEAYANIHLYNIGLADKKDKLPFYLDCNYEGDSGASSLLEATESYLKDYIKDEKQILVDCITVQDFMTINNLEKIDFLWLDIEGFEYFVLDSAKSVLPQIKYIYTEVNFVKFRNNSKLYDDILNLMTQNGFTQIAKWEQGSEWGTWQGNVLFCNNNLMFSNK